MWYTYILQSTVDDSFYVGITNNLRQRFKLHNQGKIFGSKFRKPYILAYYEAHNNKYDAAAREQFLKTGWDKNWIKKVLKNYIKSKKLGG